MPTERVEFFSKIHLFVLLHKIIFYFLAFYLVCILGSGRSATDKRTAATTEITDRGETVAYHPGTGIENTPLTIDG